MTFQWRVYPWENRYQQAKHTKWKSLLAQDLVHIPEDQPSSLTVNGLIAYADRAYLSCRVLMLAGHEVHPEALYCAAQTIEKYLKALLLDKLGPTAYEQLHHPTRKRRLLHKTHDLGPLAREVARQCGKPEFDDAQFIELCEILSPFEVAGRYPDSEYEDWIYSLDLVTFLDFYVAHCRELLMAYKAGQSGYRGVVNVIHQFVSQAPAVDMTKSCSENPVMKAAHRAYLENNRLETVLQDWDPV